jgi:hypothetical protein
MRRGDRGFAARAGGRFAGAAALALLLQSARPDAAGAQPAEAADRVVVASLVACCADAAWAEAEEAIRDELELLGLEVEVIPASVADDRAGREEMRRLAEARGAACALRISRGDAGPGAGVELWLADRVTGKTLFRQVALEGLEGERAASLAAIRAVETLRASLIELRLPDARPELEPPPAMERLAEEAIPPVEAAPGPVMLWLAAGIQGTPGGIAPQVPACAGARYALLEPLALEGDLAVTVWSPDVAAGDLRSSFDALLLRLWLLWTPGPYWRVHPLVGGGAGIAVGWATGSEAPGVVARTAATVVAAVAGRIGVLIDLTDRVNLRLDFTAGALLPELRVLLDHEAVGRAGLPLLEGTLGLGLRL